MKNLFFLSLSLLITMAVMATTLSFLEPNVQFSDVSLANIEALAQEEIPSGIGEPTDVTHSITRYWYATDEPGWEWNVELSVWFFEGSVSSGAPSASILLRTETVTYTYVCCQEGGIQPCNHIQCSLGI